MIEQNQEINNNNNNNNNNLHGHHNHHHLHHLQHINNNNNDNNSSNLKEPDVTLISSTSNNFHFHLEENQNDWIELSDENVRLKKLYDKLRCEYNDLEFRFENILSEKASLNNLFQQQMTQICDMKRILNNSIDLNEYDRIRIELEHSDTEIKRLINRNKLLKKQLDQKENDLQALQPVIEDLREQNEMLREQISNIGENRDITAKLLCDIDLMQTKINEYLVSIANLSDENQELRNFIEQYRSEQQNIHNQSFSSTLTSPCTNVDVFPSRKNSINGKFLQNNNNKNNNNNNNNNNIDNNNIKVSATKLDSLRYSCSTLNLLLPRTEVAKSSVIETMADVKINDLEQQIVMLKEEMNKLKEENRKLLEEIQKNVKQSIIVQMNDQLVQTDPISLTIETKKIVRCPLDHIHDSHRDTHRIISLTNIHNRKQQPAISKRKKKRRFLCLF